MTQKQPVDSSIGYKIADMIWFPDKLEFWTHQGRPVISVKEVTPGNTMLGPAFCHAGNAMGPVHKTMPSVIGGSLQVTGDPNCVMTHSNGIYWLWTTKEVFPREPLSIDDRLYDL